MKPLTLEDQLQRSIAHVRAKKVRMTEQQQIVVHRDVSGPLEFSAEQVQLLRDGYAPGATEVEFKMLLEVARLRRLNPFLKQLHFVKRKSKDRNDRWVEVWTSQVSIDGLRAIAQRTGLYDGQDEPTFERDKDGLILSARVCVYRKDWSRPAVGVARWSEYVQTKQDGTPTKFWDTMPHVMIGKCAEALALRKAFPEDLAGIFTDEEMEQADNAPRLDSEARPRLDMHTPIDEAPDAGKSEDAAAFMARMTKTLEKLKSDVAYCKTWDEMVGLRTLCGSQSKQSELLKQMQDFGPDRRVISGHQHKDLSKIWQHCDRQLTALEGKLKPPPVEASFVDPIDDDTDAFAPTREPGEEG